MKVAIETVDAVRRRLAVEVPEGEVTQEIERAYSNVRRTANVRGFRQGRAPRAVLERMFGDQVRAEVFAKLIQASFRDALREQNIEPVGEPEIVTERAEPGAPLRYSVTVQVKPTVEASGYAGLEVERPLRRVDDADVERVLTNLQDSLAQLHPITDRAVAQPGDVATIDLVVRSGDRVVAQARDQLYTVGAREPDDGIGAHLEGMEVGSSREFVLDRPSTAPEPAADRALAHHVALRALARKELPPLDDEFAKDHGDCDTLDDLRRRIRAQLEAAAVADADGAVRGTLIDQLVQRHDFEVPRAMVEQRAASLLEELFERMGPRRPTGEREAALRAQLRPEVEERARHQVKASLVLEAIARQEQLQVQDEDVEAQINSLAERAGNSRERVRALYQEPGMRASVKARLLQARALDVVVNGAHIRTIEAESSIAGREQNG